MSNTAKWLIAIIVVIIIVCILYFGLGQKAQAPISGEIKVGVILPLTGTSADNGNNIKNGLLLAQSEINASSSVKINLIFEDSQYKSEEAVKAVEKLINLDKVKYIIGDYGSSQTLAIAPITEKNKVLLLTPGAQTNAISKAGDYVFRVHPSVRNETTYFVPEITRLSGKAKVGVLALNTDMGKDYSADFSEIYKKLGGQVGLIQMFEAKDSDYKTMLLKYKNEGIENLLFVGNRKMSGMVMRQIVELKLPFKVYMALVVKGEEYLSVAGKAGEGIIFPNNKVGGNNLLKNFETLYQKNYGAKPGFPSIVGYDALKLLSFCLSNNGDNVEKVKSCLYKVNGQEAGTIRSDLSFDQNGDLVNPQFELETVQNGQFVPLGQ
ncbi:MAG: ABC transporter substrate-binding protein [Candidatus Paceibacterota bacterium]|jgi:branched-chain amino acid transport system substrate-binding protein